ncbi:MAG: nitroreductase [Pseudomonadota bacterium]
MPEKRQDVLDFLLTRRSRPAKTLGPEAPDRAELEMLLTAASRTPDHGKLVPWRFVVLSDPARRAQLAETTAKHMRAQGYAEDRVEKLTTTAGYGGAVIAVIASPKASASIPVWEQELAAGGVCLALVNAALAAGWGANWLTGPLARDADFLAEAFGATEGEFVAGFIHIGNERMTPADRDRPDLEAIVTWH